MNSTIKLIIPLVLLASMQTVNAQPNVQRFEVETEPVAYILSGAGVTGAYQSGPWNYSVEVFGIDIPESLHGNEGFDVSTLGTELHVERFFGAPDAGFFAGPEVGIGHLDVTHRDSGIRESHTQYSVGLRGGYRWYTGLGDLYLSPVAGLVYALNAKDVDIRGATYASGPVTPFATVGIGWSF